jgi:ABC-type Fe3+ transport system permease subunit
MMLFKKSKKLAVVLMLTLNMFVFGSPVYAASSCTEDSSLLGFPTWYKYLNPVGADCEPQLRSLTDFWLIAAALLEILLRIGILASVIFITWAGFRLLTSQGDPNSVKEARDTILNAVIGLIIMIIATVSVNFFAGRF